VGLGDKYDGEEGMWWLVVGGEGAPCLGNSTALPPTGLTREAELQRGAKR
jgi:hypothetical protein